LDGELLRVAAGPVRIACIALLAGAFVLDLVTPQLFVAAILLNAPIALSTLTVDRRFTQVLVVAALVANVTAGYVNGMQDGAQWNAIAIGDRVISALSFILVGVLSVAGGDASRRAGEAAEREQRIARERDLARAGDEVRRSVNGDLIARAIVREALNVLPADAGWLFMTEGSLEEPTVYRCDRDGAEVELERRRLAAPLATLLRRIVEEGGTLPVTRADPIGRLLLDTLGFESALGGALAERQRTFGIVLVATRSAQFPGGSAELFASFLEQSSNALAQAALFAQLAERNEALAHANASLAEQSEIIRDIVYALSHDLRTPLAAAGMTLRQALDGAYGELPAAYREIVRRSVESNDELLRLAETLLLVSRYESGEASVRRVPIDLGRIAHDVVAELAPLWERKALSLTVDDGGGEMRVLGEPGELRRALVNLVANAVTFTPNRGSIRISLEHRPGERVRIIVEDDGYGVPEAERARLFQRLPGGPSRQGAGTGLGLYIVRRIAENHGGSVAYAPRAAGGSIFEVDLPAALAPVNA
jgi:signal transduction histidine kinase